MSNTATTEYLYPNGYAVKVNGATITVRNEAEATAIRDRLNRIYSDQNRDLDFITPSIVNGDYVVCCPKVRKDVGDVTYLYDTNGSDGWKNYPEKLYEPSNWSDSSSPSEQTAILTITSGHAAWWQAVKLSNLIRAATSLNFSDAAGRTSCQRLYEPSNSSSSIDKLIAASARCDYYGLPCQGTQPGTHSSCPELGFQAENIANVTTSSHTGSEVFHPQDLTAAMTSSNTWYATYKGKYVRVTNLSNSKSVVVRVTDVAPANKGIELAYRPWAEIGKPAGANSVKIELMA